MAVSIETAREYLKQWNRDKDIVEFEVSSATVELAAKALQTEEARIAKTLSFNYEHYEIEGPPSIEFLLIGGRLRLAFITFASSAAYQYESFGFIVRDGKICRELVNYFDNFLIRTK
jgi:hypothetical protein